MADLNYPTSLPCPRSITVTPWERRQLAAVDRPREARALQRDRATYERVTWPPLTGVQVDILMSWWRENLVMGGAWFVANWPTPRGSIPIVRKFVSQPQRTYIAPGFWQWSAMCETRGLSEIPQADEVDPYAAFVRLLMHFEDEEGTRPVVDVRGHTGTWRQVNDPFSEGTPSGITTFAPLMGSSSVRFAPYGTTRPPFASGALIAMYPSSDFAIAGDFTVEFLLRPEGSWRSAGSNFNILTTFSTSGAGETGDWGFAMTTEGKLAFGIQTSPTHTAVVETNAWGLEGVTTAIAAVRSGDTLRLFTDGVLRDTAIDASVTLTDSREIGIGAAPDWTSTFFNNHAAGLFDEIRLTAFARYGPAGYTPRIAPFPNP